MTTPYQMPPRLLTPSPVDEYIHDVVRWIPDSQDRERAEQDLLARLPRHAHIADIVAQYGPPRRLAESYVAGQELESAPFFRRVIAALIDIPSVMIAGLLIFYVAWKVFSSSDQNFIAAVLTGNPIAIVLCVATVILMSPTYYVVAESLIGRTVGKAIMGLRVVTESGTKVSMTQAIVRQIPLFFSFYVFDAAFALFTEKKQRLFEMLSRTRVVRG